MRHSRIALGLTIASMATAIFCLWFVPFNGLILGGLITGTGFIVVTSLFAVITYLLDRDGN